MKNILIIAAFLSLAVVGQTKIIDSEEKFVIIVKGDESKETATTPENSQNETEPAEYPDYKFDSKKITVNETQKMYKFEAKDGLIKQGNNTITIESVTTDESNYPTPENLVAQQSVAAINYPTDTIPQPYMYMKFKLCPVPMVDYVSVVQPQNPYMPAQYVYQQQRTPKNVIFQYVEPYGIEQMKEVSNIYEPSFEHNLKLVDQTKMPSYSNEIVGDFPSGKIYKYYQNNPTYSQDSDTNSDHTKSVYYTTRDKYPTIYESYQQPSSDNGPFYQSTTKLIGQNPLQSQHYPRTNEHFSPHVAQGSNTMHNVYEILPYVDNVPSYQMMDQNQLQAQYYPKFKKHVHTGSYIDARHNIQDYQVIENSKEIYPTKFLGGKYYGDDGRQNHMPKRMHKGLSEDLKYSHNIDLDPSKYYYRNHVYDDRNKNIYKGKK